MALFAQYAMAAAQEAVEDSGLDTLSDRERENVVCGTHSYDLGNLTNRVSILDLESVVSRTSQPPLSTSPQGFVCLNSPTAYLTLTGLPKGLSPLYPTPSHQPCRGPHINETPLPRTFTLPVYRLHHREPRHRRCLLPHSPWATPHTRGSRRGIRILHHPHLPRGLRSSPQPFHGPQR
jgi:hypothetical protein